MQSTIYESKHFRFSIRPILPLIFIAALFSIPLSAQQPSSNSVEVQRQAMKKLSFLAGQWSGPVTIVRGPAGSLSLTQSESVQYKLDGLVMLIQGKSVGADGKAQFQALATISYDDSSQSYHIRAYNDRRYVDSKLTVLATGFEWGFAAGPAHIVNTMHLTAKGEWQESSEVTFGGNPPRKVMSMLLSHES